MIFKSIFAFSLSLALLSGIINDTQGIKISGCAGKLISSTTGVPSLPQAAMVITINPFTCV